MTNTSDEHLIIELGDKISNHVVGFTRFMRGNGYNIGVKENLDALKIVNISTLYGLERIRWGLQALFCSNRENWRNFDRLFDAYWKVNAGYNNRQNSHLGKQNIKKQGSQQTQEARVLLSNDPYQENYDSTNNATKGGASIQETHEPADFSMLADEKQVLEMERLIELLAKKMCHKINRQQVKKHRGRIYLQRTIRNSLSYGGMPIHLILKSNKKKLPSFVVFIDVSRSMSLYSFFFLHFARGIVKFFEDASVFAFHTRLLHITGALRHRDIEKVKEKLTIVSSGWSGGTRIAKCLEIFNRNYASRVIKHRPTIIIMSDGYDTDKPEELAQQLHKLQLLSRKIVWLNPLLGHDNYEPIAGGMQASLPFIDLFAPAYNLKSLLQLKEKLIRI